MIFLDTNVCLHYCVDISLRYENKHIPLKLKYTDAVRRYINTQLSIGSRICLHEIVEEEFTRVALDVLAEAFSKKNILVKSTMPFLGKLQEEFSKLKAKCMITRHSEESLKRVKDFYVDLWNSSEQRIVQMKRSWSRYKKKRIDEGPPTGADIKILAAAYESQGNQKMLITLDSDFLCFKEEIRSKLGVIIVDAATLKLI